MTLLERTSGVTRPHRTVALPARFAERFAKVNGVRLRYLVGGQGSAVVLLHGYAETGHMWRPIMPLLAEGHTVVVPDLRGAGGAGEGAGAHLFGAFLERLRCRSEALRARGGSPALRPGLRAARGHAGGLRVLPKFRARRGGLRPDGQHTAFHADAGPVGRE